MSQCPSCGERLMDVHLEGVNYLKCSSTICQFSQRLPGSHPPPPPGKEADPVNHPSHYTQGGIECIDAIEAALTKEQFIGFLKGNSMKYLWRNDYKGNPSLDAAKTQWYTERLIKTLENENGR